MTTAVKAVQSTVQVTALNVIGLSGSSLGNPTNHGLASPYARFHEENDYEADYAKQNKDQY